MKDGLRVAAVDIDTGTLEESAGRFGAQALALSADVSVDAEVVALLASGAMAYANGSSIVLDGGWSAHLA